MATKTARDIDQEILDARRVLSFADRVRNERAEALRVAGNEYEEAQRSYNSARYTYNTLLTEQLRLAPKPEDHAPSVR